MSKRDYVIELIKTMTGQTNILTIPRMFIDLVGGDIITALFLSQCIYWSSKKDDGWFYKSSAEWREELSLSYYQIKRSSKALSRVLQTKVHKANGTPTVHYKVDFEVLKEWILEFLENGYLKNSKNEIQKTKESLTEITTEITTNTSAQAKNACALGEPVQEKPSSPEKRTDAKKRGDIFDGILAHATNQRVDLAEYPEDTREILEEFCNLWGVKPPRKKKGGEYALWIRDARDLLDACGEFGKELLDDVFQDWRDNPFMVGRPGSLLKAARAMSGKKRRVDEPVYYAAEVYR